MKNLFLTFVALISCTNLFAQYADDDNTSPVFIETEIKCANVNVGEQPSLQDICDFSITDEKGNEISTGDDVEMGTVLTINFTKFYDKYDYKLINIQVNDKEVTLDKNGVYKFTVDDMNTISVSVAKVMYDYSSATTFVSFYDGTADKNVYEFDGIYGNKVYGIPTKTIEAGKPYIVLAGGYTVNFDAKASAICSFAGKEYNGFYPSTSNLNKVSGDEYLVVNDGIIDYSSTSGSTVTVGRAYFVASEAIKTGTPSSNAEVIMTLAGETTGIANISADYDSNAPVYGISGQRISNSTRGLVIINGKKVVRK